MKPFAPLLYGRLLPIPGGSRVRVRLSLHPFTVGFLMVIYAFTAAGAVMAIAGFPMRVLGSRAGPVSGALFIGLVAIAVALIVRSNQFLRRSEEQLLWKFLEDTFSDVLLSPDDRKS